MEEQLELVFAVAPGQQVVVTDDGPLDAGVADQVVGKWDSVRVLKDSGLALSPVKFHQELRRQGVMVCPFCRRYRRAAQCVCEAQDR